MDPVLLSLISACTALVASIAGPIVTLVVAKRQFNATVLSANRQKWIETLRDLVAELVSLLVAAAVVKSNWKDSWNRGQALLAGSPAWMEKLERLVRVQWKIRLLLNPTESDHQGLDQAIDCAIKRLQLESSDDAETEADLARITTQAQAILKREWVRVKRGVWHFDGMLEGKNGARCAFIARRSARTSASSAFSSNITPATSRSGLRRSKCPSRAISASTQSKPRS